VRPAWTGRVVASCASASASVAPYTMRAPE
jgi:hypothetical protein